MVNEIKYDPWELWDQMQDDVKYSDKTDDEKIILFINYMPRQVKTRGLYVFDNFDRFTDEVTIESDFININRIEEFTNYKNNLDLLIDKSLKRYLENRTENKDSIFLKLKTLVKNEKIEGVSLFFYTLKIGEFENFGGWEKIYIIHSNNKIIGNEIKNDLITGKFDYEKAEFGTSIVYSEYFIEISDYYKLFESNTVEFSLRSAERENIKVDFQISEDTSNIFSSFQKKLNNYLSPNNKFETKEKSDVSYSFNSVNELTSFEEYLDELERFIENPAKKEEFLNKANAWLEKNSDPGVWIKFNGGTNKQSSNNTGNPEISNKPDIGNKLSSGFDVDTLKKLIEAEQFPDAKNYIKEKTGKNALDIKIILAEYAEKFGKSEKYKKYEKKMDIVGYSILIGIVLFLIWIFT